MYEQRRLGPSAGALHSRRSAEAAAPTRVCDEIEADRTTETATDTGGLVLCSSAIAGKQKPEAAAVWKAPRAPGFRGTCRGEGQLCRRGASRNAAAGGRSYSDVMLLQGGARAAPPRLAPALKRRETLV